MSLREARDFGDKRLVFSSGSDTLDRILGSGLRTGEMIEVFGASTTGKTQLAISSRSRQPLRGSAAPTSTPRASSGLNGWRRSARAGGSSRRRVLPLVYCIRAEDAKQQAGAIGMINENEILKGCRFVAVDTVTKNFTLEFSGGKSVATRQTALGAYLNRMAHGRVPARPGCPPPQPRRLGRPRGRGEGGRNRR